jgi:hypothetical protein
MEEFKKFEDLKGQTIISYNLIKADDSAKIYQDELHLHCESGKTLILTHQEQCCEHVYVEDICGDFSSIMNTPVLKASVVTQDGAYNDDPCYDEETLWTFYNVSTLTGDMTIRWLGSSNGYYSVEVDCFWKDTPKS